MKNIFLVSDTHFGHEGVTKFLNEDGSKLRPWDDVAFKPKTLKIMERLNGDKVLIKGNHDTLELKYYTKYFRDIRACHILDNFIMTHIPIHPESLSRWIANIHGHMHHNHVMLGHERDRRYYNVCVEQTEFKPIAFDVVIENIRKQ